jgi:hypothetical protein
MASTTFVAGLALLIVSSEVSTKPDMIGVLLVVMRLLVRLEQRTM